MKILKKILSIITLLAILLVIVSPINVVAWIDVKNFVEKSNKTFFVKQVILSKIDLKKIKSWDIYKIKIDELIYKIKDNEKALNNLSSKIIEIRAQVSKLPTSTRTKKVSAILNYLDTKVNLEKFRLSLKKSENLINEKNTTKDNLEKRLEEMQTSTLSKADTKKINDKIVQIQLNTLKQVNNKIEILWKDFKKLTNHETKGDFKFNMDVDHDLIWKVKSTLELNNYKVKSSWFNSQFSGELKILIDSSFKWQDAFKIQLSSFIDFITKDENMYILINKLNIENESSDLFIKEQLEILKKIAEKNKYIKFSSEDTTQILESLKNLNPSKILSQPLLKAYKKQGNRYYLIPTKYACDTLKELSNVFDPFNGSKCSESQYNNFLEEMAEVGELYMEIWTHKHKLGFDMFPQPDVKSWNSYIIFTNTSIDKIKSELLAKDSEGFKLEYIKNQKLDFTLNIYGWHKDQFKIKFNSILNNKNQFTFIDSSIDFQENNNSPDAELLNAKLTLKNRNIVWNFEYSNKSPSLNDVLREPWHKITSTLTWKLNRNNKIQDLNFSISWSKINPQEKFLDAEFTKNFSNYTFKLHIMEDEYNSLKTDIKLQNKNISWTTTIVLDEKEFLKITHSWKYEKDYLKLNNKIDFNDNPFSNNLLWNKQDAQNSKVIFNIRELSKHIEMQLVKGNINVSNLISENNKINFIKLRLNEKDFKNSDWSDFLIFIKGGLYQIYWEVIDSNWNIKAVIRWNTIENLVKINWKTIKNWDIVWKAKIQKQEKLKTQANINFNIDSRFNKSNFNLYIDYIEWDKKILEIEIDNKSTVEYKTVNIQSPNKNNTINIKDVFSD